jgi:hypothetical protein
VSWRCASRHEEAYSESCGRKRKAEQEVVKNADRKRDDDSAVAQQRVREVKQAKSLSINALPKTKEICSHCC